MKQGRGEDQSPVVLLEKTGNTERRHRDSLSAARAGEGCGTVGDECPGHGWNSAGTLSVRGRPTRHNESSEINPCWITRPAGGPCDPRLTTLGGKGGIRTHGGEFCSPQSLSRRPLSTSQAPSQGTDFRRRGRDSNPRGSSPCRFQDGRLQPLGHLSAHHALA